jgi:hypothetical protein
MDDETGDKDEPAGDVLDQEELVVLVSKGAGGGDDHAAKKEEGSDISSDATRKVEGEKAENRLDEEREGRPSPGDVATARSGVGRRNVDLRERDDRSGECNRREGRETDANPPSNVNRTRDDDKTSRPAMEDVKRFVGEAGETGEDLRKEEAQPSGRVRREVRRK